jgi:hypothetical protein
MADGVTSAGSAPPANQTTNASQSQAQSQAKTDAQAALFGEALEQCPEGLHRPRPNDAPCTYLRPPSLSSQSQSQSSQSDQVQGNPDRFKSPITRSNGGDDYKKPTPKLEEKGVKVPDGPKVPTSMSPSPGTHLGGWEWKF